MTMNRLTFPCSSCGGPVEPLPGKTRLPCPYCGSVATIPENLRLAARPVETLRSAPAQPPFIPPPPPSSDDITDVLRQVQPLATSAVKAYGFWALFRSLFRRVVPACAIVLIILCVMACGAGAIFLFLAQRGG
jgi:hypothetical protein